MYWFIIALTVLLTVVAGLIFLKQLNTGLSSTTGLNDKFNWGLYIQGFFFLSALAAGILIFIAVVTLFDITYLKNITTIAAAISFSSFISAGILLGADVGKPFRTLEILFGKNFTSPLTWDFYLLGLCLILNLIFLTDLLPSKGLVTVTWSLLCLIAAFGFVMVHTLFFLSRIEAGLKSQPFLGLETLSQSLWGGSAAIGLVTIIIGGEYFNLVKLLQVLTILAIMPMLGEYISSITIAKSGELNSKLFGLNILILILLSFTTNSLTFTISIVLILLSVFLEKGHLIKHYQKSPAIPYPFNQFEPKPNYVPTVSEWLLTLGGLGTCIWLSTLILYFKGL